VWIFPKDPCSSNTKFGVLGDAVLVTLAAQITTLPIVVIIVRQSSILSSKVLRSSTPSRDR